MLFRSGAQVRLVSGELLACEVDAARARPGDDVTLGVRPEHLSLEAGANRLRAEVTFVEQLGSATFAYGTLPGADVPLICQLDGRLRLAGGQSLSLGVAPAACHLFDAHGQAFRRHAAQDQRQAA